jgi:hypothetical protein
MARIFRGVLETLGECKKIHIRGDKVDVFMWGGKVGVEVETT